MEKWVDGFLLLFFPKSKKRCVCVEWEGKRNQMGTIFKANLLLLLSSVSFDLRCSITIRCSTFWLCCLYTDHENFDAPIQYAATERSCKGQSEIICVKIEAKYRSKYMLTNQYNLLGSTIRTCGSQGHHDSKCRANIKSRRKIRPSHESNRSSSKSEHGFSTKSCWITQVSSVHKSMLGFFFFLPISHSPTYFLSSLTDKCGGRTQRYLEWLAFAYW